jgi:hypothetical protein
MFGYCASGNDDNVTAPANRMTSDSTVANIGRSMKKWEITAGVASESW